MDCVDLVDDDDRVIGVALRDEAHRKRLLHRFVQVFVVNSQGHILVQRRSAAKKTGPLLFDASVGGHVDAGEDYYAAVRREGSEELGLPADADYWILGSISDNRTPVENMIGKLYLYRSDGPFTGWETEAERLEWMTPQELAMMTERFPYLFTGGMLSSVALYKETVGRIEMESQEERIARVTREYAVIAQAEANIDAGLGIEDGELDAFLDDLLSGPEDE